MSLKEKLEDKTAGPRPLSIEQYRERNKNRTAPRGPEPSPKLRRQRAGVEQRFRQELADLNRVAAIAKGNTRQFIIEKIIVLKKAREVYRLNKFKKKNCKKSPSEKVI